MKLNNIINGDCLEELPKIKNNTIDLVCCDPPYNIGYKYDKYQDNLKDDDYLTFSANYISEIYRILKDNGSFWLLSGSKYVSELDIICKKLFYRKSWVIWYYQFGQNQQKNFTPSHTHLLYYVKDKNNYTFNDEEIRIPSLRQTKYKDKRANPKGKIPDNVWCIPRLCGTFKERVKHSCQLPLALTDRIIKTSSNKNDIVLDPMCGSGSFLVSAKKLDRKYIGIELSKDYCKVAEERLK